VRGWALAEQNRVDEGIAQTQQGLEALQATGAVLDLPRYLALRAESYGRRGQMTEGRKVLAEALAIVNRTGERYWEAELYRLQGELTLQQSKVQSQYSAFRIPQSLRQVQRSRFKVQSCYLPNP
jgi:predicted ATPase